MVTDKERAFSIILYIEVILWMSRNVIIIIVTFIFMNIIFVSIKLNPLNSTLSSLRIVYLSPPAQLKWFYEMS